MKKILTMIFILASLVLVFTGCSKEPEFIFELHKADEYMVSLADANGAKKIVIPDSYNGKPVTAIKQEGFLDAKKVKEIVIPDSIKSIGYSVFARCTSLKRVEIGAGLETIGGNFNVYVPVDNSNIQNSGQFGDLIYDITINDSVTFPDINISDSIVLSPEYTYVNGTEDILLSSNPFYGCESLSSIEVSESNEYYKSVDGNLYTKNGESLVQYATGKRDKRLEIPEGVKSIEGEALFYATNLVEVKLPASYEWVDEIYYLYGIYSPLFIGCTGLKDIEVSEGSEYYSSVDGNLYSKDGTIFVQYAIGKGSKSFSIPEGVTEVASYAFDECESLEKITLSSTVESLRSYPINIAEINVDENNSTYSSIDGVLYSKDAKTLIYYPVAKSGRKYTTPDSVEIIGVGAFAGNRKLVEVTLGNGVKEIGVTAFSYCEKLKNITLGDNLSSVGDSSMVYIYNNVFFGSEKIKYNEYSNVKYLGNDSNPYLLLVGAKDTSIESCEINPAVKVVQKSAFSDCESLKTVSIPNGITEIVDAMFEGCKSLAEISIPDSVTSIGASAFYGCESLTNITIPSGVTEIGESAFRNCVALTKVTLPDGITEISDSLFSGCKALTDVSIPDGVTSIGYSAFSECESLANVTIPSGVTEIGESAFRNCVTLTKVTLPDGITEIAYGLFSGCKALSDVYIPDGVTKIGRTSFGDCASLINIELPSGITEISDSMFAGCENLNNVVIPDGVTEISNGAFTGCEKLEEIVIPEGVVSIGNYAFKGCVSLSSITIPDSVTKISRGAFSLCEKLTEIVIPEGVTLIENQVFSECDSLKIVTIHDGVTAIDRNAFRGCNILYVYYEGTEEQWKALNADKIFPNAEIYFEYQIEE